MPRYRDRRTQRIHQTVAGSHQDRRFARLDRYENVDVDADVTPSGEPARNASREVWADYARTVARTSDEADAIDGLSRDELIDLFAGRSE